jgi:hypothetical protein
MPPESLTALATCALAIITGVLAYFTYQLWTANKTLVEGAREAAKNESKDMRDSIAQAARAAAAMEQVASVTRVNAELMSGLLSKQMRAYVQVNIGKSTAQRDSMVFGSWPEIVNVGLTPAKNVSYRLMADIMDPALMLREYVYPQPEQVFTNDATLNPRQQFTVMATVKHRFEPSEVEAICKGEKKRLYVWGTITYDDVFGGHHETRFSHNFLFFDFTNPENNQVEHKVNSFYSPGHNDAT